MNEKEHLVLQTIKKNPYLSQQEMAEQLNMSRPTLANIISGLIKKGEIIGRAYVLPEENAIVCIGGANVDRKFHINESVQYGTSNPAHLTESVGGVARNIAENLGRLGNNVKLITTLGLDQDAETIKQTSGAYINFDLSINLANHKTGSYSAVLDSNGELILALADMAIYDLLLPTELMKHDASVFNAKCIIVDLNCPKETILYLQNIAFEKQIPFIIVPVSSPKMKNMPDDLIGVSHFICNLDEAEMYLNTKLQSEHDYIDAVKRLLEKGAQNVVLTLGGKGVIAGNLLSINRFEAVKVSHVEDVTGAGDAFVSALTHGVLNGEQFYDAVKFGLYNAAKTLQSDKTVRQDLSVNEITIWRNL
ncbi:PfkB family carbohydrate kinase [Lysinibacillus antri]|uniref:Winged helix-turn-helix transcriptional regulator n=1 Tax=Lysinibacillus antri TaxID=2498145 RepID=A0A432LBB9_9BACI|nr:PfkB family carbohydrate kinase [Lysinibacillus antri]RUL51601.1 winged helix-turn-helix transcriptional regulator [Lysinibacillus antri]